VIKAGFIKKQVQKSQRDSKTTEFLRRLTFQVVDEALLKHYEQDYPMKCLQASVGIQNTLKSFGVNSRLVLGEACMAQVFANSHVIGWNGFWGEDHHHWLFTEYSEVVDLTIRYLHIHPAKRDNEQLEMPSVWWGTKDATSVINYLGTCFIEYPKLPEEDQIDLTVFEKLVQSHLEDTLEQKTVEEINFEPVISGMPSLNKLDQAGNPWVKKAFFVHQNSLPLPEDYQEKLDQAKEMTYE